MESIEEAIRRRVFKLGRVEKIVRAEELDQGRCVLERSYSPDSLPSSYHTRVKSLTLVWTGMYSCWRARVHQALNKEVTLSF